MNIYVLSIITISILFIPVSFASAQNIEFAKASDGSSIYLFVQIIHRDSNGNLLGFIQSDRMQKIEPDILNYYVDQKGKARTVMGPDPNGPHFEIFGEKYTITQEIENITASTLFVVEWETDKSPERIQKVAANFGHEGLVLSPGDTVATVWNFARFLP
jgi:hypothetical protein